MMAACGPLGHLPGLGVHLTSSYVFENVLAHYRM